MPRYQDINGFRAGTHGLAFKNGKLYEFSGRHVLVMRPWPLPMAWYKRRSHNWRPTRKLADKRVSAAGFFAMPEREPAKPLQPFALPNGQLVFPGFTTEEWVAKCQYQDERSRLDFIRQIPSDVRHELARYRDRCWHLLSVLARCPGALDLSQSSPALLFALASNWVFHKPAVSQPIRAVRSLVNRKQCVIQQWLGFPGTESVRRILAKIAPEALSIRGLVFLRSVINDPVCVKLLGHLPVINESALALATHYRLRAHVTPCLLRDALQQEKELDGSGRHRRPAVEIIGLMQDTVRMCEVVRWEHCPTTFHSLRGVKRLHDALVPRVNEAILLQGNALPENLPAPPFGGTDEIVPLTTVAALVREGQEQHNCVAVRASMVARGCQYLYSVRAPVRGTLSVRFNGIGWMPSEFLLACNKPVPAAIRTTTFNALFQSGRHEDPDTLGGQAQDSDAKEEAIRENGSPGRISVLQANEDYPDERDADGDVVPF